ncbi:MAG TPA: FAD-dependent oxidoreductase [Aeriscardovia aeriphila]|uniref:NADH oxidase n=1 Tax=Aeriscardovia aeriphila TaxID=218139 RepID=A0A921KBA6_9BIFI|nr:FAD-dependent oxidoreductase [Aeriscardovia aeriphila]
MGQKVIVIGANHAGISATTHVLDLDKDAQVHVFDADKYMSFLACGMALWIGNQISTGDGLFYSSREQLEAAGAKVSTETEITGIDYEKKTVTYKTKDGEEGSESYDKLVLATGSSPIIPRLPGIDLPYVQRAKQYEDAQKAVEQLKHDDSVKTVTVVGAGYIGAELAEAYQRAGKKVILIDALDRILGTHFDRDFSEVMADRMRSKGIEIHLGELVQRFEGEDRVRSVVTNKGTYDTDLVIMCIGFRPNTSLARGHLQLFRNGAILVDKHQRTSDPDVYAVGDCATTFDNSIQATSYIALATNAVRSGMIAGMNIAGRDIESCGVEGSSGLCLFDLKMVCTGQTVETAAQSGIQAEQVDLTDTQKPAFMNEVGENPEVKIRIVYRRDNHEVIGAQLMSEYDMSATIHMFSLAIQERVTIERIALSDIFFMPHFNQPHSYINEAALQALH